MPRKTPRPSRRKPAAAPARFEAEVLRGLRAFAEAELTRLPGARIEPGSDPEAIPFTYRGDWRRLRQLRTVVAVYLGRRFVVPRPKALLGQEHFQALLDLLGQVRAYDSDQRFAGFRFSAAGSDSAVFMRLAGELERATGLAYDPEGGELLLRIRPGQGSWEVLARLTPRPLSARAWRVCNLPGGLNATVAAAMFGLAGIQPGDRVLDAMCGSATLLIERRGYGPARRLLGVDIDPAALECARQNVAASGFAADIELQAGDATSLPLAGGSFELIAANLPWGDAVGSARANASLYPGFLREAARLTGQTGRLVLLTHAMQQFEAVLGTQAEWAVKESLQVYHGGHHPRLYLLHRHAE